MAPGMEFFSKPDNVIDGDEVSVIGVVRERANRRFAWGWFMHFLQTTIQYRISTW